MRSETVCIWRCPQAPSRAPGCGFTHQRIEWTRTNKDEQVSSPFFGGRILLPWVRHARRFTGRRKAAAAARPDDFHTKCEGPPGAHGGGRTGQAGPPGRVGQEPILGGRCVRREVCGETRPGPE